MRVVHSDNGVTVIEFLSDEELWELVESGELPLGEEVPTKLVVKGIEAELTISTPKFIEGPEGIVEHSKRERMKIDYRDYILMNRTLKQIFDYKSSLLPR